MKLNILVTLITGEQKIKDETPIIGYLKEDLLTFDLDDMHHTIDLKKHTLERENEDYAFKIDFETKECILLLKKEQHRLDIECDKAEFNYKDNQCKLSYLTETLDEAITLELSWEVLS